MMGQISRISALAATLCLIGCQSTPTKSATSAPSRDDVFHKKMECEKYYDKLKENSEQDQYASEAVYRVFYSPKRNSCFAARYTLYFSKNSSDNEKVFIDDILSHEEVWSVYYNQPKQFPVVQGELDDQIKQQGLE